MKTYHCIEATLEVQRGQRIVRLWFNQAEVVRLEPGGELDLHLAKIEAYVWDLLARTNSVEEVARTCANKLADLNAVQVIIESQLGRVRKGIMIYTVPFTEETFHVSALDPEAVAKYLEDHADLIAAAVQKAMNKEPL